MDKTVYEVKCPEDLKLFLAWMLKIKEEEEACSTEELSSTYNSFRILWDMLKNFTSFTIVIEDYYIDRIYSDSYYMYYSCKHFNYSRFCKRIFLFCGIFSKEYISIADIDLELLQQNFMGSVVIRPLKDRAIGRSLLNPKYFVNHTDVYLRTTPYEVIMKGIRLDVEAFPYSMQDGETTSCAEITILNILDYFSIRYPEYHYLLPSDICRIAEINSFDRRLPTRGLRYELITRIFTESGFYPRLYDASSMDAHKFKYIMHYYVESGIPVALGIETEIRNKHSIICIGHGSLDLSKMGNRINIIYDENSKKRLWLINSADLINEYYVMDDNKVPYSTYCWDRKNTNELYRETYHFGEFKPNCIMVPLYKRMFLEATDAYDICTSILIDSKLGIQNLYVDRVLATKENPLIIRLFMASSRSFRSHRVTSFKSSNRELRDFYIKTPFPEFIWVCELYTKVSYPRKAIGEIIIDATSAPNAKTNSLILLQYPSVLCYRMPEDVMPGERYTVYGLKKWQPFDCYTSNLIHI